MDKDIKNVNEKIKIKYPIIVEGKYDKIKICSLFDATVITTDGFGIFNKDEKAMLIRRLANNSKIILLCDSDGGGHLIRSYIKTLLKPEQIINLYIPMVEGKEKRKKTCSKEGLLGVEGTDSDKLKELLMPFSTDAAEKERADITKADLYKYGLSGRENSAFLREKLLKKLDLPTNMTPNAMLLAINILYTKDEILNILDGLEK